MLSIYCKEIHIIYYACWHEFHILQISIVNFFFFFYKHMYIFCLFSSCIDKYQYSCVHISILMTFMKYAVF